MDEKNQQALKEFSYLYEKFAPGLLFYARKFVSYPVAEDIVHDVFLNIWRRDSFLFVDESIASYLFQSVQNACLNHLKRQTIHQEYIPKAIRELKIEELTTTSPEVNLINKEHLNTIYQAIDQLPEKCREVFLLSYMEGKKNAEIADLLQISIRTVENHLYKGLQILRKTLPPLLVFYFLSL